MSTHAYMIVSYEDILRHNLRQGSFTPVIVTNQASIKLLAGAVFSLLMRTRQHEQLEHFMVFINGPDPRTGDTSLQDRKQKFLEDLRNIKWERPDGHKQDMPMTVNRLWSRIGHSELCDMAVPWITTQYYVLMHDDVVILDHDWIATVGRAFAGDDVAVAAAPPLLMCPAFIAEQDFGQGPKTVVLLPHLNTAFIVADKIKLAELRVGWKSHHVQVPGTPLGQLINYPQWVEYHRRHGGVGELAPDKRIQAISFDIGAWVYDSMCAAGMRGVELPHATINHVRAASWDKHDALAVRLANEHAHVYKQLEDEIRAHPAYWAVYSKHCLGQP